VQTHQLDRGNNACVMTVTMPMQFEGKEISGIMTMMLVQQRKQHPCNVWDGASATRATTPLWQRQIHLRITDGNDTIVMGTTTPAWQQQQCHCNKGNNVIVMMLKMPGLQRRLGINDGDTVATSASMSAWQQQRNLVLGCLANLKETSEGKGACLVEVYKY
jgi:hypothetical protein